MEGSKMRTLHLREQDAYKFISRFLFTVDRDQCFFYPGEILVCFGKLIGKILENFVFMV